MDRECRDPQNGFVDLDELLSDGAVCLFDHYSTSDTQIAVEPCMPQPTTVCLDANLQIAFILLLRYGLYSKTWRVCVCADHADGVSWLPLLADGEGDDGGAITGQVVLSSRLEG